MLRSLPVWRASLTSGLGRGWRFVRELSGDDAYERYLRHLQQAHPDAEPLNAAAFQRQREAHKWSGIQRCC